jgi:hypothetical protein
LSWRDWIKLADATVAAALLAAELLFEVAKEESAANHRAFSPAMPHAGICFDVKLLSPAPPSARFKPAKQVIRIL